ncbi:hypothetical protein LEP1GSC195_3538 [Leptospira wolbachii serovar Codice str. CDC]|uniref:Uncharacterized protein n=1 Tax=Leptospira wolbachii serovar Codice str. CDC TaxID=1218599 RepID=R9A645_9LEPT|nr:hypothetical protein LEP1GSC195_3538 [Leptospira wolbachii serovar Codice str. CDC]
MGRILHSLLFHRKPSLHFLFFAEKLNLSKELNYKSQSWQ